MGLPKFGSRPASERGSNNDCRNSGRGRWRSRWRRFHPYLALGHNVAKVDPDAKSDAALLGHRRIAISHPALNLGRASHRIDNAGEFRQQVIACGLDDRCLRTAGIGASSSLPCVRAEVPSPNPQRPFALSSGNRSRLRTSITSTMFVEFAGYAPASRLRGGWIGGEDREDGQRFGKVLEILGETLVSSEPGEDALARRALV
jgi:hypothetical protein